MPEENNIELRSEEYQEVLRRIPSWILRWGIKLIFCVLAILFIGSYFFKYPEIIAAPIVVTTENLPVNIVAKTSGRIDTLYITEKQRVTQGQLLAEIENTANLQQIILLKNWLKTFHTDTIASQEIPVFDQVGEIQSPYNTFQKALNDYVYFLNADYHRKKIQVIEKSIVIQYSILQKIRNQLVVTKTQLESEQKLFEIDSTLYQKKVIANVEYETARNRYLQNVQAYETAKMAIDNQKMSILQSEQTIFDLEQQRVEQNNTLSVALTAACDQLNVQLLQWEQTYLMIAPIAGTATFTKYWQKNQNVTGGETILTVVPSENQRIIGKIYLPSQGAGKVKTGQTVNVKFDHFPYMEYGMVKVEVKNIALVPIEQGETRSYVIEVDFPENLTTTYGKNLIFSQQMTGTAEIITDDLRLLDRLLNPIRAVVKR
jgi:HlyD family secretion protein